jgi:hypothetical protein
MTEATRALVLEKLRQAFPDEQVAAEAVIRLDSYQSESSEQGAHRVQLAILKLSGGDLDQLRQYVEAAKQDFRDVLAGAEYPEEMRVGFDISPEERRAIQERDRKQYLDWLQRR